jgi:hypothetical protein
MLHCLQHLGERQKLMLLDLCKTGIAICALIFAMVVSHSANAEEIIIEEGSSLGAVLCGDYACSPCLAKLGSASLKIENGRNPHTIELTAGELWQFFDAQGYGSVNKMTLFLDVDQLNSEDSFNLSKLNLQIQSPLGGKLLTDANLGADNLIVPGYETSSSRPEAELRFDLGYDFMELFTRDSQEIVRVSIDSPMASMMTPTFHLSADDNVFGRTNLGQMFMFVMFWGVIFLTLLRWMKPVRQTIPVRRATPMQGRTA